MILRITVQVYMGGRLDRLGLCVRYRGGFPCFIAVS